MSRRRCTNEDLTRDPAIITHASAILKELYPLPLGSEKSFASGGKSYVAVLERHYHEPGGPLKPWGPHKGISVFELTDEQSIPVPPIPAQSGFVLGARSLSRLAGVHPDLVRVVKRAIEITAIDFTVVEGLRTLERQKELVAQGKSQTLKSRHLTGHAVDLAPYEGGTVHWDWPRFHRLAGAVSRAAIDCLVTVEWGGNWKSFPDGPHWQLPWKGYP